MNQKYSIEQLCESIQHDKWDYFNEIIKSGVDINGKSPGMYGKWPLLIASQKSGFDWLQVVLKHGAKPDLYSRTELTTNTDKLRILLEHGANPNGESIFSRCLRINSQKSIDLLMDYGADLLCGVDKIIDNPWDKNKVPLFSKVFPTVIFNSLLKYEIDWNRQLKDGNTILHHFISAEGTNSELLIALAEKLDFSLAAKSKDGKNLIATLETLPQSEDSELFHRLKILVAMGAVVDDSIVFSRPSERLMMAIELRLPEMAQAAIIAGDSLQDIPGNFQFHERLRRMKDSLEALERSLQGKRSIDAMFDELMTGANTKKQQP